MVSLSTATANGQGTPRVFLSYSHDSPEHAARVLALALQLRRDGVDARIDQFDAFPPEGWPQWCARQILDARFTVLICTETYRRRFLGYEQAGVGRGVKWEAKVVQNILYNDEGNVCFIPAVFAKSDEQFIPETVQEATRVLLGDFGAGDAAYALLLRRFTGGQAFPPLSAIMPTDGGVPPEDASVPTQDVWDEAARIFIELAKQEKNARGRHRVVLSSFAAMVIIVVGVIVWNAHITESIVADPVILRAKLEEKIDQAFERNRDELLTVGASSSEIDELYRWRDRAKGQVAEGVAFITMRAGDVNSPIIRKAATVLEERGVDAALEFLDATLKAERQRRKEEGRQLAEASLMKSALHASRFETSEQERAIRDAITDAPDWWLSLNQLGVFHYQCGQWEPAAQELEMALNFVPADARATVLTNLGVLYLDTNRIAEAEPLLEEAVKVDEKSSVPDASPLNNLAQLYKATNRLAQAEPLLERALKIDEMNFGPEHPSLATHLGNLAQLYQATNRRAEAEQLMVRALKIEEKKLGAEDPNIARDVSNLAELYRDMTRLGEAEPLMERALKINEKRYLSEHPNVAISLNNLAELYRITAFPQDGMTSVGKAGWCRVEIPATR